MLLQIDRLRLSLAGDAILRNVRVQLDEGEIYGLLGPNGAGKSTTIAAALGLLAPDSGTIRLFGETVDNETASWRRRVGVLPEHNGFYDWMTAGEYLAFCASLYGKPLGNDEMAARISRVGLAPRDGQAIGTFSRGMRQRLGLARALIPDPELLILDEPTNGLDPRGRRDIHDILLALAADKVGILLCTHLLDDVDRLCSRIGIIVDGCTVAEGPIVDLVRQSGPSSRFWLRLAGEPSTTGLADGIAEVVAREGPWWQLAVDASRQPQDVWQELMLRGWPIVEIESEEDGLEALYLALTEENVT